MRSLGQLAMVVAVMSAFTGLLHYYLWSRLVSAPALPEGLRRPLTVALVVLGAALPLGILLSNLLPRRLSGPIAFGVFTWMGLAALLFFALLPGELVRLSAWVASKVGAAPDDARRTLLARVLAGGAGALAFAGASVGLVNVARDVGLARVRVSLKRLPPELSGLTIAQLTDVHIGPTLGRGWLERVVDTVNRARPDVVVITGDLVDGSVESLREHTAPLGRLEAKHGVFFVTGNHEYYSGADEWIAELARLGIKTLRNERVSIGEGSASFDLAGVDDWSAKRFGHGHGPNLAKALSGRDEAREVVLLAHQPKQALEAASRGVGLVLSGHTHGGQLWPWTYLVRLDQPFIAGLSRLASTQIYVSRGTGYWGPPMRLAAPAEITLLELEAG
jgi:predicted MPP superfamily phosphohydrolase